MRPPSIVLDDATELAHRSWFAPVAGRPIPISLRNINLSDARNTSQLLGTLKEAKKGLYGFRPIPAGGRSVTNELVNDLRDELGF